MPVTVSYPGLYLEELPSNARSIVASPTSIAVFVGYTHPFKTRVFGQPVRLFSYSDYEREFGGIYVSGSLDANVAHAVYQFFLNGGSDAYVVGLLAQYQLSGGNPPQAVTAATATLVTTGGGIVFTAKEPTDHPSRALTVTVSNVRSGSGGPLDLADYTFTYGTRVESYRGVPLTAAGMGAMNSASSLVAVTPDAGNFGTVYAGRADYAGDNAAGEFGGNIQRGGFHGSLPVGTAARQGGSIQFVADAGDQRQRRAERGACVCGAQAGVRDHGPAGERRGRRGESADDGRHLHERGNSAEPERRNLFPLSSDIEPGDGRGDGIAAGRVRGGSLRAHRHAARGVEGTGGAGGDREQYHGGR